MREEQNQFNYSSLINNKKKEIALWAINGIGLGHSVRISLIAKALQKNGYNIRLIVEHENQLKYFKSKTNLRNILISERPWKSSLENKRSIENIISSFLSKVDGLICDMASIPKKEDLENIMPKHITPIFLLRWMTRNKWENVVERVSRYKKVEIIIVTPKIFFENLTDIKLKNYKSILTRIHFINGFIFRTMRFQRLNKPKELKRIAFCFGAGGIHTKVGLIEIEEVMKGLFILKNNFKNKIGIDAWIGNSNLLKIKALKYNIFDSVKGINNSITPNWDNYDIIIGRCGYNTLLEIMNSKACFVTGNFETDEELTKEYLKFLTKYGIFVLSEISSSIINKNFIDLISTKVINDKIIKYRKSVFNDGMSNLISIVSNIINSS